MQRDSNQNDIENAEPVPAASTLGTDDEVGSEISQEERLRKAQDAEQKVGDAPSRHR